MKSIIKLLQLTLKRIKILQRWGHHNVEFTQCPQVLVCFGQESLAVSKQRKLQGLRRKCEDPKTFLSRLKGLGGKVFAVDQHFECVVSALLQQSEIMVSLIRNKQFVTFYISAKALFSWIIKKFLPKEMKNTWCLTRMKHLHWNSWELILIVSFSSYFYVTMALIKR